MILIDLSRDIEHKMAVLPNHPQVIVTAFATHDEVRVADAFAGRVSQLTPDLDSLTSAVVKSTTSRRKLDHPSTQLRSLKAPPRPTAFVMVWPPLACLTEPSLMTIGR